MLNSDLSPTCVSIRSGQRWVGWGDPSTPQMGWTQGWEPVAIKVTQSSASVRQEVAALQKLQSQEENPHVIQLVDSYTKTDESSGVSWTYIITRWATMTQHHDQQQGCQMTCNSSHLCCIQQLTWQ